jgi:hypothetical protein
MRYARVDDDAEGFESVLTSKRRVLRGFKGIRNRRIQPNGKG